MLVSGREGVHHGKGPGRTMGFRPGGGARNGTQFDSGIDNIGGEGSHDRRLPHRRKEVRHLPLVERGARCRVPRLQAVLREGRQQQFHLHGQEQRPLVGRQHLPALDGVGEDNTVRLPNELTRLETPYRGNFNDN